MAAQMRLLRRNSCSLRKDDFGFVFLFHKFDLVFFLFPSQVLVCLDVFMIYFYLAWSTVLLLAYMN